jgi:hypothetical protein
MVLASKADRRLPGDEGSALNGSKFTSRDDLSSQFIVKPQSFSPVHKNSSIVSTMGGGLLTLSFLVLGK